MNINYILNKSTISTTLSLLKLDSQSNDGPNSIESSYDFNNNNNNNNIKNNNFKNNNDHYYFDGPDPINFILNETMMDTFERQKNFLKKTKLFNFEIVDQYFHHYNHLTFGEKIFTLSGYQLCQNKNNMKPYFYENINMQELIKSIISYSGFVYYRLFDLKEASLELGFTNYNSFTIFKEIIDILETLSVINHYKGTHIYKWNGGSFVNKVLENIIEKKLIFEPNEKSKEINNILFSFILNKKVIKNFNSFREKMIWDVLVASNIIKIVNNGNDFIINECNSLY